MKKTLSLFTALCLALTIQYGFAYHSMASNNSFSPSVYIEVGTYKNKNERGFFSADTIRHGREKTSANVGEKIVVTFILTGIDKLEYFQIAGNYNQSMLKPGYYDEKGVWNYGNSVQDFDTIIDNCSRFDIQGIDSSFSFTSEDYNPSIYICGYSPNGSITIPQSKTFDNSYTVKGTPIISVGFDVLCDIDNIYDAFVWDTQSTVICVDINTDEYTLNNMSIECPHQYQHSIISPTCEESGYSYYSCIFCNYEYRYDFKNPIGHFYIASDYSSNQTLNYICIDCDSTDSKTKKELMEIWNKNYINTAPKRTSADDSCYLDTTNDNIINVKDFAVIHKMY